MDYLTKFSQPVSQMSSSSIRELLKFASDKEFISLAAGAPDTSLLPVEQIEKFIRKSLAEDGASVFQYGVTEGYGALRDAIVEWLHRTRGMQLSIDEVTVTSGAQNAIDSISKVFINQSDKIVVESPTFLASLKSFRLAGAEFLPVMMDHDGINLTELRQRLSDDIKFIYLIPNFQNPTGATLSKEKRIEIANLAKTHDLVIVEDDPYYDLNYSGETLPTIYSLAPANTIYIGSFSKSIAPGLRTGFVVAEKEVVQKITQVRQVNDVHANGLAQRIINQFIRSREIDKLVDTYQKAYRPKLDLALKIIAENFPSDIFYTKPTGGMFIWVELPVKYNLEKIYQELLADKVGIVKGEDFFTFSQNHSFRINFTQSNPEKLEKGLLKVGKVLRQSNVQF